MKLPWDRNYLKICFHVIFTLVVVYILVLLVNSAAFIITNLEVMLKGLSAVVGWIFSVLSVLVVSFVIAFLLNPLVDFFQKHYDELIKRRFASFLKNRLGGRTFTLIKGKKKKEKENRPVFKKRTEGAILAYIFLLLVLSLLFFAIFTQISDIGKKALDENNLAQDLITSLDKTRNDLSEFYDSLQDTFEEWGVSEDIQGIASGFVDSLKQFVQDISAKVLPTLTSAGGKILDFLMALVVAFYFLRDKDAIKHKANELLGLFVGNKAKRWITTPLSDINAVFSGYILGQLTDAGIMAALLSIALSAVGVPFAVIIGLFSGLSNIVPYFGAVIGFVLSVTVSLISGDVTKAIYAGIVVIVLQQLDGMFIVPRVVGKKVALSPALVLLSLSIGGSIFGFVGILFAVPATAILKVFFSKLTERLRERKETKRLYSLGRK